MLDSLKTGAWSLTSTTVTTTVEKLLISVVLTVDTALICVKNPQGQCVYYKDYKRIG